MPIGPGRYDDLCGEVHAKAQAVAVLLIVMGGNHGDGFSAYLPPELAFTIPGLLRRVADEIEASVAPPTTPTH